MSSQRGKQRLGALSKDFFKLLLRNDLACRLQNDAFVIDGPLRPLTLSFDPNNLADVEHLSDSDCDW